MSFNEFKGYVNTYLQKANVLESPVFSHDCEKGLHKAVIAGIMFLGNGISRKITVKHNGHTFMFDPQKRLGMA